MKKIVALLLTVVMGLNLVACGSGSSSGEGGSDGEAVELSLWYWDEAQTESLKEMCANFTEKNPNITISVTQIGWDDYWTKLQAALPTGSGPDIMWMHPIASTIYAEAGLLMPLNDLIERDNVDISKLNENLFAPYVINGETYGLPKDFDTIGLWYNKAMFDAAGIEYPNENWTWDDYLAAAQKLTIRENGKTIQYGTIAVPDMQAEVFNLILQNGGQPFSDDGTKCTLNTPEVKEAIQFELDLMHKYNVSPTMGDRAGTDAASLFAAGQSAMMMNGCWRAAQFYEGLGDDLGVAPLPGNKERACIANGLAWSGSTKSKYQDEVWEFLKYSATEEGQLPQAATVIPAYSGAEQAWIDRFPSLDMQMFIDALEYGHPYPVSKTNASSVDSYLTSEMTKLFNQPEVGDTLATIEAGVQEQIDK